MEEIRQGGKAPESKVESDKQLAFHNRLCGNDNREGICNLHHGPRFNILNTYKDFLQRTE